MTMKLFALLPAALLALPATVEKPSQQQVDDFKSKINAELSNFQAAEPQLYDTFMEGIHDEIKVAKNQVSDPETVALNGYNDIASVMKSLRTENEEIYASLKTFFANWNSFEKAYKNWYDTNESCASCGVAYPAEGVYQENGYCYFGTNPSDGGPNTFQKCQGGSSYTTWCPEGLTFAEDPQTCIDGGLNFYEYEAEE